MDIINSVIRSLWEWVKAISTLTFVGVVAYKIYITPFNITVDFPTLLSLLLALFSVALAALFYFKATDTSNTFYDNTYNFTKDIAQLLVKIESGFGERLRHLDEGYSSMRDYMQKMPPRSDGKEAKQRIEEEKEEIKKVAEERDQMILQLLERTQLHDEEKSDFLNKLKEKEHELEEAQHEISKVKRRLVVERMKRDRSSSQVVDDGFKEFTKQRVIEFIGLPSFRRPASSIKAEFNCLKDDLPDGYIEDLEQHGYLDSEGELTRNGVMFLRHLAREME